MNFPQERAFYYRKRKNKEGIDLSSKRPKRLNDLPPIEMDYLITMGCEETCPVVLSKNIIEWNISDPKGKSINVFQEVRDMTEKREI